MKRYNSKRKKEKPDKFVKRNLIKLYISGILMLLIVLISSFNNSLSLSFRNFITHTLRYSTDFNDLANKTVKFAENCFNEYKNSEFDVFNFSVGESESK